MEKDNLSNTSATKATIFISYSRDDLEFADQLNAILQLAGFETIIDREDIHAGESWHSRLGELIRRADTIVFVLSPASAKSDVCSWELEEAERLGKRVLPVVCRPLENTTPPALLTALNYIFFYPEPRKSGTGFAPALYELVAALNTDLTWLREHTRYLERAMEWEKAGRSSNRLLFGQDIVDAKVWADRRPKDAPEILPLHLEFIRASEQEAQARASAERKQLEAMAAAQSERASALQAAEHALEEKQAAQQREQKASRLVVKRTKIGAIIASILAAIAIAAGLLAIQQKERAEAAKVEWQNMAQQLNEEYLEMLASGKVSDVLDSKATPGKLAIDGTWRPIIKANNDKTIFAATRNYHQGRIFAVAHDGVLDIHADNPQRKHDLSKRAFLWLGNSLESEFPDVLIAESHCEWFPNRYLKHNTGITMTEYILQQAFNFPTKRLKNAITDQALKDAGILVIGNAWGNLSDAEMAVIEKFVKNGGGLMIAGLGWSWRSYSQSPGFKISTGKCDLSGQDIDDLSTYPMNRLGKQFGVRWASW